MLRFAFFVTLCCVARCKWFDHFTAFTGPDDASTDAFTYLEFTEADSMSYPYKDYRVEDNVLYADLDAKRKWPGYYVTVGPLNDERAFVDPTRDFLLTFDVAAYRYDIVHSQGYGYTFTLWTLLDGAVDQTAPMITFHTGMPSENVVSTTWQKDYPQFTTRIDTDYGTCFAHLFEDSKYTDSPCVYNPDLSNHTAVVGDNYAHESVKLRVQVIVDLSHRAFIWIGKYDSWNSTEQPEEIVSYHDETTWATFLNALDDPTKPRGFAVGSVLTGLRLSNFRVAKKFEYVAPSTTLPASSMTAEVQASTSGTAVISTDASVTTSATPVLSSVPSVQSTQTAEIIHSTDDNTPNDEVLITLAFAASGVCAFFAVLVVCFSEPSRRAWGGLLGSRKRKLQNAFESGNIDALDSQTETSDIEISTVNYGSTGLVKNGAIVNNTYNFPPPPEHTTSTSNYEQVNSPIGTEAQYDTVSSTKNERDRKAAAGVVYSTME